MDKNYNFKWNSTKITLAILLFIAIAFFNFSVLVLIQNKNLETVNNILGENLRRVLAPNKSTTPVRTRPILQRVETADGDIVAYRLNDDWSTTEGGTGIFAIQAQIGDVQPIIFGAADPIFVSRDYQENSVFAIVNSNQLWVLNSKTNSIDLYELKKQDNGEHEEPSYSFTSFEYLRSISAPKYAMGGLYGISCTTDQCKVETARHYESGCIGTIDIASEKFVDYVCNDMGGQFTPEVEF